MVEWRFPSTQNRISNDIHTRNFAMLTEKAITICLLEVLREFSDENHILSMGEIISKLNGRYGLKPDRRTIYSAMETLIEIGYDVSLYKDNGKGYYLLDHQLEPCEAHLLSDAVCTFPFISERQTAQLMSKVQSMVSVYERKQIKNLTVMRTDQKTVNKNVFYNIEVLDEAIEKRVKVKFDYCEYGVDKQLHKRRERKYVVNPYGLVYTNEHYYLICIMEEKEGLAMYRVDRIQNIELTEEVLDLREPDFDSQAAVKSAVYAYTGPIETVELLVDPKKLSDVIDKFGTNITIGEHDDGRLKITLKASVMGMKYWALQYLEFVEVVRPEGLRKNIKCTLSSSVYNKFKKGEL